MLYGYIIPPKRTRAWAKTHYDEEDDVPIELAIQLVMHDAGVQRDEYGWDLVFGDKAKRKILDFVFFASTDPEDHLPRAISDKMKEKVQKVKVLMEKKTDPQWFVAFDGPP